MNPHSLMTNVLGCDQKVSSNASHVFALTFWKNTHGKCINPQILTVIVINSIITALRQWWLWHLINRECWYIIKKWGWGNFCMTIGKLNSNRSNALLKLNKPSLLVRKGSVNRYICSDMTQIDADVLRQFYARLASLQLYIFFKFLTLNI